MSLRIVRNAVEIFAVILLVALAACSDPEQAAEQAPAATQTEAEAYVYSSPGNLDYCRPDESILELVKSYRSSYSYAAIYVRKR